MSSALDNDVDSSLLHLDPDCESQAQPSPHHPMFAAPQITVLTSTDTELPKIVSDTVLEALESPVREVRFEDLLPHFSKPQQKFEKTFELEHSAADSCCSANTSAPRLLFSGAEELQLPARYLIANIHSPDLKESFDAGAHPPAAVNQSVNSSKLDCRCDHSLVTDRLTSVLEKLCDKVDNLSNRLESLERVIVQPLSLPPSSPGPGLSRNTQADVRMKTTADVFSDSGYHSRIRDAGRDQMEVRPSTACSTLITTTTSGTTRIVVRPFSQRMTTYELQHQRQCPDCGETFKQHRSLAVHRRRKHAAGPGFRCEECGEIRHHKPDHLKHLRSHEPRSDQKSYQCKLCLRGFNDCSTLMKHKRTHKEVGSFKCECGSSYRTAYSLKKHTKSCSSRYFQPQEYTSEQPEESPLQEEEDLSETVLIDPLLANLDVDPLLTQLSAATAAAATSSSSWHFSDADSLPYFTLDTNSGNTLGDNGTWEDNAGIWEEVPNDYPTS